MARVLKGVLFLSTAILVVAGCAPHVVKCPSPEDTPERHYLAGMELVEKGMLDEAAARFERAGFCDEHYGPALSGMALTGALKARAVENPEYRKTDVVKLREVLARAWKESEGADERFAWRLSSMRVETALKEGDWLDEVEDDYRSARRLKTTEEIIYYRTPEAAEYFMGEAYLDARDFQKARESFSAVLNARAAGKWHAGADAGWKRTDKIVRALSGMALGEAGKKIATLRTVTRADLAALLVDELRIDALFSGMGAAAQPDEGYTPADVIGHPFRDEVTTLVRWSVRGIEPVYDSATRSYLFRPSEPVRRKELALALEDALIKITGDEKMASAFLGHSSSPFPDIAPSAPWYNAAMSMTTRNIMETGPAGEFRPEEHVDGADAVMAIRALKFRLNLN